MWSAAGDSARSRDSLRAAREVGGGDARASEQQNVLSAHYMPAGISSLSGDRPPFVIKQRTNPVMEQRWAH